MNLVTTQHSSNKFGSAFAAPRFSDLLFTIYFFLFMNLFNGDGKVSKPDRLCNGAVGGDRFWSSESHKSLLLNGQVATESYVMKSVFTRTPPLIRTPKIPVNICCA